MKGIRSIALGVTFALIVGLLPTIAHAQVKRGPASGPLHSFGLGVWPTAVRFTAPSGAVSTWNTTLVLVEYRMTREDSPWGARLRFATGSESPFSGTDRIWTVDATLRLQTGATFLRAFAGYGSLQFENSLAGGTRATSSGLRVGADASLPLGVTRWGGLFFNASLAWSPSNSVSVTTGGVTTTSTESVTDWEISIGLKFPPPAPAKASTDSDYRLAVFTALTQPEGPSFDMRIGYRGIGSTPSWTGIFIMGGKTF